MERASDSEWNHWIETAKARDIRDVALQFGAVLRRQGAAEWVGPCPACGGRDRFAVNTQKLVFNCRGAEDGKGDCISLVMHVKGLDFLGAVEAITGIPRPDRTRDETDEARANRERFYAARAAEYARRQEDERRRLEEKAQRDEIAIADVLHRAVAIDGTMAEAYMRETRGLEVPKRLTGDLRFVKELDYWGIGDNGSDEPIPLAVLPAIIAVIRNVEGDILGLAQTYLDFDKPVKWTPIGSPTNSAKKIRGKKRGGMIRLGPIAETIVISEGWENALAWWQCSAPDRLEDIMLAAAVDLGNLAGQSTGTIELAWLKDTNGRPLRVSYGEPDLKAAGVIIPTGVKSIIIPCDNDSEPIATIAKLRCAVKRFQAQGIEVTALFWPPPGADWNHVLLHKTNGTPLPNDTKASDETKRFRHPGGSETGQEFLARTDPIFTNASWSVRKPIVAELKPVPAFDADTLLPEALRRWIIDEAERMPCPQDFIAAAAIVALGSIIGTRCAIRPKSRDSWLVVPNLWGGIVGDPSDKKSPAMTAALKPMECLIVKAQGDYDAALRSYEADEAIFDAVNDAIEKRLKEAAKRPNKGDPREIAKELQAHRDQTPKEPTAKRYKTNDGTAEKLGELLRSNPNGLLVQRDELVGLVATWEREGREGERSFFLEAWNGNQNFDVDRIGRGHIHVPNLCLSVFGGIQPDKLTVYLEQAVHSLANDGMLQRFQVLVYPDSRPWEWRNETPDIEARNRAIAVFEKLSEFDPVDWDAAPADEFSRFPHFRFSDEAQRVFIEWSGDLHQERIPKEDDTIIHQHLSKFDKLFPALALVFHLVDCAAKGVRGPVTREAALRAAAWCEYLEGHARRCYGLLKDDGLRAAQTLAAKLERGARDVRRHQWRNLQTDEAIQAAVDWLEDEGWIRGEPIGGTGPGSGRRTTRYRIHPEISGNGQGGCV
jgi:hypothetical protein